MTQPSAPKPPSRFKREWNELRQQVGFWHVIGGVLAAIGALLILYLAFKGQPQGGGSDFITAIIAILFQAGSAAVFAYSRRFDPRYAQSALAHLSSLARQAEAAVKSTQEIIESTEPNPEVVLQRLRMANVEFSFMQEWALDAADDWLRVLNQPLKRTDDEEQNQNGPST